MSELRDLTRALRIFDSRLTGIENCLVVLMRDSQQQAEWRHDEKNRAMVFDGLMEERDLAVQQVQTSQGLIHDRLSELVERIDALSTTRLNDVKVLSQRVRELEENAGNEETTKP